VLQPDPQLVMPRQRSAQPPLDEASWAPIVTPAGIGPSWVSKLAATTSRRPVFRAHATTPDLRRRLWSNVRSHTGRRFDIEAPSP
jgi:hypothetical protein